jgi:hypothetical protein
MMTLALDGSSTAICLALDRKPWHVARAATAAAAAPGLGGAFFPGLGVGPGATAVEVNTDAEQPPCAARLSTGHSNRGSLLVILLDCCRLWGRGHGQVEPLT